MSPPLRDYQVEFKEAIAEQYRRGSRRVLGVSPTGSGKTTVFASICEGAAKKGKRVLLTAHREQICDQISDRLLDYGIAHGNIRAGCYPGDQQVLVGMIQTLARRKDVAPPDLIIVDEAHLAPGPTYSRFLASHPNARHLLVTATPCRTDGKGMGDVADAMVNGPEVRWLIDRGFLSEFQLLVPPSKIDTSRCRRIGNDLNQKDLQEVSDKAEINGDALQHYLRHCRGNKHIVFTTGTAHSQHVAEIWTAGGVPTKAIWGDMEDDELDRTIQDFRDGKLLVIAACDLITEGFDVPDVGSVSLLRETESMRIYRQSVGRALRPAAGKKRAVILDHVGNSFMLNQQTGEMTMRHGPPDMPIEWSLDGEEQKPSKGGKEAAIRSKRCVECPAVFPAHMPKCPVCGAAAGGPPIVPPSENADVELVEWTPDRFNGLSYNQGLELAGDDPDAIRAMRSAGKRKPGWAVHRMAEARGVSLEQAAKILGYNPAMVRHMRRYGNATQQRGDTSAY